MSIRVKFREAESCQACIEARIRKNLNDRANELLTDVSNRLWFFGWNKTADLGMVLKKKNCVPHTDWIGLSREHAGQLDPGQSLRNILRIR